VGFVWYGISSYMGFVCVGTTFERCTILSNSQRKDALSVEMFQAMEATFFIALVRISTKIFVRSIY
jgi:hypothetical protein